MQLLARLASMFSTASIEDLRSSVPLAELKKRVKVVVADDEETSFPTKGLQDDGYTVEWWPQIDQAKLRRLEEGDFDIIVLDIQDVTAPQLSDTGDGLGVLRRLKRVNPDQIVVAFSGKAYDLDSVAFFIQATDVLRKPVTLVQCKELLDRLIADHINVDSYWRNLAGVLSRSGVPESKIKKLEKAVTLSVQRRVPLTMDEVRDIVGTIDAIHVVFGWIQRIVSLCLMAL